MGNPVVHFEIGCKDIQATCAFYESLFGWSFADAGEAMLVDTGSSEGIRGHISALGHEPHHYVNVYVKVDDIRATIDKAISLGGKLIVGPIPIPVGQFAWLSDVEGTTVAVLQEALGG